MNMDTSSLTNLKFEPVKKDRLYFDKFNYSMCFHLDEVSCLRCLDHAYIDDMITRRMEWREVARKRWKTAGNKAATILSRAYKEITPETVANLHALAEVILAAPNETKLVVSVNQAYVYTNDLQLIEQLDRMPILRHKTFCQAQVVRPKNTIALKRPQHQLRSYFKLLNLTTQQKIHLEAFLMNHQQEVRISPAFLQWLAFPYNRLQDYFFVDHNTESWLTMLNLVVPGCVRKTMHIIPAK